MAWGEIAKKTSLCPLCVQVMQYIDRKFGSLLGEQNEGNLEGVGDDAYTIYTENSDANQS